MHNGIRKAKLLRPSAEGGAAKLLFLINNKPQFCNGKYLAGELGTGREVLSEISGVAVSPFALMIQPENTVLL